MRRRSWIVGFFGVCVLFTILGCTTVSRSIKNYEACKGDPSCMSEMEKVKESSYVIAKSASSNIPLPSVAEIIAVLVSNGLSFGYGVFHGKRKG